MTGRWRPALLESPLFADLNELLSPQQFTDWPTLDTLNASFATAGPGRGIRFVRQSDREKLSARRYERRIFERGEVPTRPGNWHDLFNAMTWALFPATKRAINAMHIDDGGFSPHRSPRRDALTLFDECGVVLAIADGSFPAIHEAHRWHEMFWQRRDAWGHDIRAMIVGHGLYQQCLAPYVGLTAKACYLAVPPDWFTLPLSARYEIADRLAAESIRTGLRSTNKLLPLPLLGIPGFHPDNDSETFYRNEDYFRPLPATGHAPVSGCCG